MIIAVCNRNRLYLNEIKAMIYRYSENKRIDVLVECFSGGDELINSEKRYDMVFIDCTFSGEKGIEIAEIIRERDKLCYIVFMSNNDSFSGEFFKISPNGYLTYPLKEQAVFNVLNEYFSNNGYKYPLLIKCSEGMLCRNTSEIMYLEANNKRCTVHLQEKNIVFNGTMARLNTALPDYVFLKINRFNIVNSMFVEKFNNGEITLKNGEKLFISRNYLKEFKNSYNRFIDIMSCCSKVKICNREKSCELLKRKM